MIGFQQESKLRKKPKVIFFFRNLLASKSNKQKSEDKAVDQKSLVAKMRKFCHY